MVNIFSVFFSSKFSKDIHKPTVNIDEMKSFYNMLLKMKKKRPHTNIERLMKMIYNNSYEENIDVFKS